MPPCRPRDRALAAAIVAVLLLPAPHAARAQDVPAVPSPAHTGAAGPWFGTWEQDFARSTRREGPATYKRVTLSIEPTADGLIVIYDMVGTRGGVTHLEWTGRFDGQDYPVQGVDYVLTNAYRRIDDRSYEIVVKVDGEQAARARATVSADGETMRVETMDREGRTGALYIRRS